MIKITPKNIHIQDSYLTRTRKQMREALQEIVEQIPEEYPIKSRSMSSMLLEWSAHNLLYRLKIHPDHTRSVDINLDESWVHRIGYFVLGWIGFLFTR